jgi:large conductance mechanosensitive channel
MLKGFKEFIAGRNVLDLAVGFIVGLAFGKVVTSLVQDIIMPPIGLALGKVNFSDLYVDLSGKGYESLAAAKAAGAPTINYGAFINTVIEFVVIAFAIYLIARSLKRFMAQAPATKDCPHCLTKIPEAATKCPACTSQL